MKLELKHLTAYLPYRLKCVNGELLGVRNSNGWMGVFASDFGQTNIPIASVVPRLNHLTELQDIHCPFFIQCNADVSTQIEINEFSLQRKALEALSYQAVTLLLQNHYDVFGLIQNGLAMHKAAVSCCPY